MDFAYFELQLFFRLLRLLRSFSFKCDFFRVCFFYAVLFILCRRIVCVYDFFRIVDFFRSMFVIFIGKQQLPISALRRDFFFVQKIHTNAFVHTVQSFRCTFFSANSGKIGVLLLHVNIDKRDRKWSDEIDEMPKQSTNINRKKETIFSGSEENI